MDTIDQQTKELVMINVQKEQNWGRSSKRKYEYIKASQSKYSTRMMCRLLDVAPNGYYALLKKPKTDRAIEDKCLLRLIRDTLVASQGV